MKRYVVCFFTVLLSVSRLLAGDGTYDGQYDRPTYFPDFSYPAAYANNMVYLVGLQTAEGERISNYEVAVYDADEQLRAVGRSKSVDRDVCTLTIPGTEEDIFHFIVVYGDFDHPTIAPVAETCVFRTNDLVGSLVAPFLLTLTNTPRVRYWTGSYTGEPTGEVEQVSFTAPLRATASRIDMCGCWTYANIDGLFDGCKELCFVNIPETLPAQTQGAFDEANPNCLVFLPSGTTSAPSGWRNCIADGKALNDIVLTDGTETDPCPFYCPQRVDLNGHDAIFARTGGWRYADGHTGWNTLVLPFEAMACADGMEIKPFAELTLNRADWERQMGFWACCLSHGDKEGNLRFQFLAQDHLQANTPYLFALPGNAFVTEYDQMSYTLNMEDKEISFVCTSGFLPATPDGDVISAHEETGSDCHLVGTYRPLTKQQNAVLLAKYDDGYDAFVLCKEPCVLPFAAYMVSASASKIHTIRMGWDFGTGVSVIADDDASCEVAFDLMGRRVDRATYQGLVITRKGVEYSRKGMP